jgi:prolyl 4-hydroxylase
MVLNLNLIIYKMVKEINNFLSDEECNELINLSSGSFDNVEVLGENIDGYRVAKGTWLEEEDGEVVIKYRKLISEITQIPTINMESINVLKYDIGGEYKDHHDFFHPNENYYDDEIKRGGQRLKTGLVYLNDNFEGGETSFPNLNIKIVPKKGKLVLWDNIKDDGSLDYDSIHAGLPVTNGFKYIAVIWIRENKFY